MSTITTLNDGITANSFRSQTNTNFANLNTDKEEISNKSTSVTTDQASNTKYPSVKSVYDWAVGAFAKYSGDADFYQYSIVRTVSGGNLTVALKNYEGNDPTTLKPVKIMIGGVVRTITSALSRTRGTGANFMNLGSAELATKEVDLFVYLGWQTATSSVRIYSSRFPAGNTISDFSSDGVNEKYLDDYVPNGTPTSTDPVVNIGRFNAILSGGAGYTWSIPATSVIVNRPVYETRWLDWIPTYGANGSMTYTGVLENTRTYKMVGDTMYISLFAYGTIGGTLNNELRATTPFTNALESSIGCKADPGLGRMDIYSNSNLMRFYKYDITNFASGASKVISVQYFYKI